MEDKLVPRQRNLRPRKPLFEPEEPIIPRRNLRRTRARLTQADYVFLDNEEDADWDGATADNEEEAGAVTFSTRRLRHLRSRGESRSRSQSRRHSRRASTPLQDASDSPPSTPRKRVRKPKILLPEDVIGRPLRDGQPEADADDIEHDPSVAFVAIFMATFPDLFSDLAQLPSPQDLEEGLLAPEPSATVELVFRRLLGLVLNRKKEIEVGRYNSALSELHSHRNALGTGPWFPPLQWKSKGNAFAELGWADRTELLHVLVHWCLSSSDRVRQLLRGLDEEAMTPWIGADEKGSHYYLVGFYPMAEGSLERTRFRLYRESNRLLANVKWEPIASNAAEVLSFLRAHEKKPEVGEDDKSASDRTAATKEVVDDDEAEAKVESSENVETEPMDHDQSNLNETNNSETTGLTDADAGEGAPAADPAPEGAVENAESETVQVEYDLPQALVDSLLAILPEMQQSEQIAADRTWREMKRARRRNDIMAQTAAIARGEGRYAGRTRRRRVDYSELLRNMGGAASDDDSDDSDNPRKRRLRNRGNDYAWREPEPETRQQRHARLLAERAERESMMRDASESQTPDPTPSEGPAPTGSSYSNSEQISAKPQEEASTHLSEEVDSKGPASMKNHFIEFPPMATSTVQNEPAYSTPGSATEAPPVNAPSAGQIPANVSLVDGDSNIVMAPSTTAPLARVAPTYFPPPHVLSTEVPSVGPQPAGTPTSTATSAARPLLGSNGPPATSTKYRQESNSGSASGHRPVLDPKWAAPSSIAQPPTALRLSQNDILGAAQQHAPAPRMPQTQASSANELGGIVNSMQEVSPSYLLQSATLQPTPSVGFSTSSALTSQNPALQLHVDSSQKLGMAEGTLQQPQQDQHHSQSQQQELPHPPQQGSLPSTLQGEFGAPGNIQTDAAANRGSFEQNGSRGQQ